MLSTNFALSLNFETITIQQAPVGDIISLDGKPNKPTPTWFVAPISDGEACLGTSTGVNSTSNLTSQVDWLTGVNVPGEIFLADELFVGQNNEYFTQYQKSDSLNGEVNVSVTFLNNSGCNAASWQDLIAWTQGLSYENLGIQQQGPDTCISIDGKPLMLITNLNAGLLTSANATPSLELV